MLRTCHSRVDTAVGHRPCREVFFWLEAVHPLPSRSFSAAHHRPGARRKAGGRPVVLPRLSTTGSVGAKSVIGPYGLTRVDYSKPPPTWPLPPKPPASQFSARYYPLAVAALALGVTAYIVLHRDQDVYEYWRQVEQGNVPVDDDDDDDDDDDE